jgi:hypothetical protein
LLTRHWRITQHAGNPDVTESTLSSETVAIGTSQQQASSHVHDIASHELSIAGAVGSDSHSIPQVQRSQIDLHVPTAPFQEAQTQLITQGKPLFSLIFELLFLKDF